MNIENKIRTSIEQEKLENELSHKKYELENLNEEMAKENKKLKEKLDKYENPKDMTLFTMWCTEKVKDENKQLKDNWNKLKEIIKKKFIAQGGFTSYEWNDLLNELLDKMQEMEGSDSNGNN